jgi:hypothetical protein
MTYTTANVGLSVYGASGDDTRPQEKRPLSPRPSHLSIGGVAQNFRTICPDCDNGFIREPDGYGCVQWTSCYSCGGTGEADD